MVTEAQSAQAELNQLNETGTRDGGDRRVDDMDVTTERRKVQRRRQIDPTTCERDYDNAEIEFMQALDAYKRRSGRMFPTCSEILEVIRDLGYRRVDLIEEAEAEVDSFESGEAQSHDNELSSEDQLIADEENEFFNETE